MIDLKFQGSYYQEEHFLLCSKLCCSLKDNKNTLDLILFSWKNDLNTPYHLIKSIIEKTSNLYNISDCLHMFIVYNTWFFGIFSIYDLEACNKITNLHLNIMDDQNTLYTTPLEIEYTQSENYNKMHAFIIEPYAPYVFGINIKLFIHIIPLIFISKNHIYLNTVIAYKILNKIIIGTLIKFFLGQEFSVNQILDYFFDNNQYFKKYMPICIFITYPKIFYAKICVIQFKYLLFDIKIQLISYKDIILVIFSLQYLSKLYFYITFCMLNILYISLVFSNDSSQIIFYFTKSIKTNHLNYIHKKS